MNSLSSSAGTASRVQPAAPHGRPHPAAPPAPRRSPAAPRAAAADGNPIISRPVGVAAAPAASAADAAAEKGTKPVDRSKGLWTRCDKCGVILYIKHLKEHHHICFGCNYHLKMNSQERIDHLMDRGEPGVRE
ncbi:Acetyl-coenzyme A carboxylase carboxyltransferase subunit beta [Monoraphidium neglectum]|uniref:Acetyl-coenzyme A carboxylase carboxyltransferase subunit beta n=1 Tax=Monoraphidium neglectum TaxID=145388 RepID=A0A0D2MG22_9CHLO|nr:Acetyl-coenzyme A carboxylase carboxyltransferase subunit beta [Monoraphidium neglectum]KIY94040.1 Acetyl-coenzyme A carboxylase carboxyltransferase subunit beta [Monoraphidium neglectum]|eukprot:XP_013893060.1 Acetyl-coenzyme A carboxylase carboxyltransferase subunit beta [Monoraphidium neglectum]